MKTNKPNDVNAYIAKAPKKIQNQLKEIRKAIKEAAPKSLEKIGYGMPYYSYKGRLVYFAFAKKHIGVYIPTPIIDEYKKELKKYETSKATIRFPLNKKIPISLIKKLLKARIKKNEEKGLIKWI